MDNGQLTVITADHTLAVPLLRAGEIVALPTETVYGLSGSALDESAIGKIFAAKNRPQDNPLIVHVSGIEMVRDLGLELPPLAEKLAEAFWPGTLTMVLPRGANCPIPAGVSCGLDTVAVRVPNNAIFLEVINDTMCPLAAPSANLSGRPSPTTARHVYEDLQGRIPLIIDGGACSCGIESTVVMFDAGRIQILRPGAITAEMLSAFGEVVANTGESPRSPGTRYKHYSPKARVVVYEGDIPPKAAGESCFVIANPDTQTLFAKFREFDESGAKEIYVKLPEQSGVGAALYNRIMKAAGL
ncbi:MAG: L-threonylcarbamoyladenylate synthase [Oscillospiraceae bacterium]|nr:L-threonylcarbamoyladenylate synthase [Oscillospiraceae bacterium]